MIVGGCHPRAPGWDLCSWGPTEARSLRTWVQVPTGPLWRPVTWAPCCKTQADRPVVGTKGMATVLRPDGSGAESQGRPDSAAKTPFALWDSACPLGLCPATCPTPWLMRAHGVPRRPPCTRSPALSRPAVPGREGPRKPPPTMARPAPPEVGLGLGNTGGGSQPRRAAGPKIQALPSQVEEAASENSFLQGTPGHRTTAATGTLPAGAGLEQWEPETPGAPAPLWPPGAQCLWAGRWNRHPTRTPAPGSWAAMTAGQGPGACVSPPP